MTVEELLNDLIAEFYRKPEGLGLKAYIDRISGNIEKIGHFTGYLIDNENLLFDVTERHTKMIMAALHQLNNIMKSDLNEPHKLAALGIAIMIGRIGAKSFFKECKYYAPELLKMDIEKL